MSHGDLARNATRMKWDGETSQVRGLAQDLLAILRHLDDTDEVLATCLADLEALAHKWETAAEDNAARKYGPDVVQASDAAATCAARVREVIAKARTASQEVGW